MKRKQILIPSLLIFSLVIYFTIEVFATSTGRVMRTSTYDGGCGGSGCHGSSTSSNTSVTFQSGNKTVDPNSTNEYTIRVSNSSLSKSGINIAVKTSITGADNIGSLQAAFGSGLQVMVDELTHTSANNMSGGYTDYTFSWTAPDKAGTYYLRAVGLAADGNDDEDGDEWNFMEPIELVVKGIDFLEPSASAKLCAGNSVKIKWKSAGIDRVNIEISADGGSSWSALNSNFIAFGGEWTWTIPNDYAQGDNFRIRVVDASNYNIVASMTGDFGIYGQFYITNHPESAVMCPGEPLKLYIETTGAGINYQWRKNGFPIAGATDSVLIINEVNEGSTGFYGVIVSSSCFSEKLSNEADIVVRPQTVISKQPSNVVTCVGSVAIFQIEADGQNIKYQWYKNNREIKGATASNFELTNVKLADADDYHCVVSGFCGDIKSDVVSLIIDSAPSITKQAKSQELCEGAEVEFEIQATGLKNTYDWYFDGNLFSSSDNPKLTIENITFLNEGTYYCVVRNNCGDPVTSNEVELTVNPKPRITSQAQNVMVMVGDEFTISVSADYATSYQWRKDKKNISGAKESTYTVESATLEDNGDYECVITNTCGTTTSKTVNILITEPAPGPRAKLASFNIEFGAVFMDSELDTTLVDFITNVGNEDLLIDSIRLFNPSEESITFEFEFEDGTILEPEQSIDLNIKFIPDSLHLRQAELIIYSNSIIETPTIDVNGYGADFNLVSNRSSIDFEEVEVSTTKTASFRVINQSNYDLTWIDTEIICDLGSDFAINDPELPIQIKSQTSKDITIAFSPTEENKYNCEMNLKFLATDNQLSISLTGSSFTTGVKDVGIELFEAYPNPSNKNIMFNFSIENSNNYKIDIIDLNGNLVFTHTDAVSNPNITYSWDGKDMNGNFVSNGSYKAVISTNNGFRAMNLLLVK